LTLTKQVTMETWSNKSSYHGNLIRQRW